MKNGYDLKRHQDIERAIAIFRDLSAREHWTRRELLHFQNQQLDSLVRYAIRHSPFYRELYQSVKTDQPLQLEDLPVINKEIMMENFDRLVTDPRLKIAELYAYIEQLTHDDYYLGEYRVLTTAGSSGLKGIFVFDRTAWSVILASVKRAASLMNLPSLEHMRVTSIGSSSPLHMSYRRAVSMESGLQKSQRLEATTRIEELVNELNAFQPEYLHTYPSIASLLAIEQHEGRLYIQPKVIVTGAEVLTNDMIKNIREAWKILPFNAYSATEGVLGVECAYHRGIHVFEDLGIVEVVDEQNRPVPDGLPGHKLLLTNLYQYTQPLIRYEISDMITISEETCPCRLPFRLISYIDGRNDDIIYLEGIKGGLVPVPPILFQSPMSVLSEVREYQVIHKRDGIHISLALRGKAQREETGFRLKDRLKRKLESLLIKCPEIHIEFVDGIERDSQKMGKVKLVKKDL